MSKQEAIAIATKIADELFRNGSGQKADRLVLVQGDRDLGGWCKAAVIDRIEKELGYE
jgi:hypothetical protein